MINSNSLTVDHVARLDTGSKEEFNKWRKEWIVENAKSRQLEVYQEMTNHNNSNGFWAWYLEKHNDLTRRYNNLYSDITAKDCREMEFSSSNGSDFSMNPGYGDLDRIRLDFIKHDNEAIERITSSLSKIGLEREAQKLASTEPMDKKTIHTLDRFFDSLHENEFNDFQIIDFYLSLSPEERISLGCKP
ncbi:hypothetical protein [Methanococcoides sp. AM1]|uniref:hypothetical protein n=1 Tax=Methanococcoides sp. AM1 TaxID=1201011 RepID=UPI0010838DE1|nr:hypothetical protein [Methanococcoides sp. AM1]